MRLLSIILTLILLASDGSTTAASDRCSVKPKSFPIANVTLSDGAAINRGIEVEIGNQRIGFRISVAVHNTRVRNSRDCQLLPNLTAESGCEGASGSSFDHRRSDTWQDTSKEEWNVSALDAPDLDETILYGYEFARFPGRLDIPKLPIAIWSDSNSTRKTLLGLGPQSSFLNILSNLSLIPSQTFGLFYGSRSQTQGRDGRLTIGGYDQARVGGEWVEIPMMQTQDLKSSICPLQVRIKDVRLNNIKGSFSLFADPDATVAACIDPSQNQFAFTRAMYERFANLTEHPSIVGFSSADEPGFTPQTFPARNEPLIGTLTITLSNGFETVIPHYELVSQERGTDKDGKYSVMNRSRIMVAVAAEPHDSGEVMPVLGGVYLSQVYLLVDYEQQKFNLTAAVQGDMANNEATIKPICRTVDGEDASEDSDGSNADAIGGGVGGAAALAILGVVAFLLRQKWLPRSRRFAKIGPSGIGSETKEERGIQLGGGSINEAP